MVQKTGYPGRRRAFTLIELTTVLAIIAILIGMLLPTFQRLREATNRTQASNSLSWLAAAMSAYHDKFKVYTKSLSDLTPFLSGDARFEDGLDSGYQFTVSTTTRNFRIDAAPVAPGQTGVRWLFVTNAGTVVDGTTSKQAAAAAAAENQSHLQNLSSAAYAASQLLNLTTDSTGLRSYVQSTDNVNSTLDNVDSARDGQLTPAEIFHMRKWSDGDDRLACIYNQFVAEATNNMQLGAGQEAVGLLPAVQRTGITGRSDLLVSYDTLRLLVQTYVSDAFAVKSLRANLTTAESAEKKGNLAAKAIQLHNFAHGVDAQIGVSISRANAVVLDTMAREL